MYTYIYIYTPATVGKQVYLYDYFLNKACTNDHHPLFVQRSGVKLTSHLEHLSDPSRFAGFGCQSSNGPGASQIPLSRLSSRLTSVQQLGSHGCADRCAARGRNAAMNSMGARMPMSFTPMQAAVIRTRAGCRHVGPSGGVRSGNPAFFSEGAGQ